MRYGLTFVVTKYEMYVSFVPSFSFKGVSTRHSSSPSPTPARSTASASAPAWGSSWAELILRLPLVSVSLSKPEGSSASVPEVVGREASLSASCFQETLSKSSCWSIAGGQAKGGRSTVVARQMWSSGPSDECQRCSEWEVGSSRFRWLYLEGSNWKTPKWGMRRWRREKLGSWSWWSSNPKAESNAAPSSYRRGPFSSFNTHGYGLLILWFDYQDYNGRII